jgi:hypothetical protein
MDWAKEIGGSPPWPIHSAKGAEAAISERGLGGWVDTKRPIKRVCYGYEVAEAVAGVYLKYNNPGIYGLGSRFRNAVEAIRKDVL